MQHSWSDTVTVAIDLEAMGVGGKSGIFQVRILLLQSFSVSTFHLVTEQVVIDVYEIKQVAALFVFLHFFFNELILIRVASCMHISSPFFK